MNGYRREARIFKALAHPIRLRILDILSRQEACVCHLTAALSQRQPYVSQQLAILRQAELVTDRRDGTLIYYRIRDDEVTELLALGKRVLQTAGGEITFPPIPKGALADCPCPHCQE